MEAWYNNEEFHCNIAELCFQGSEKILLAMEMKISFGSFYDFDLYGRFRSNFLNEFIFLHHCKCTIPLQYIEGKKILLTIKLQLYNFNLYGGFHLNVP